MRIIETLSYLAFVLVASAVLVQTGNAQHRFERRSDHAAPDKGNRPEKPGRGEWLATGGHAWDVVRGIVLRGTAIEGGAPGKFEKTIDLSNGYSRVTRETGPMRAVMGFDGVGWVASNGIVNSVDVPALVEDARSQAFVDRAAWRAETGETMGRQKTDTDVVVHYAPAHSSEVEVTFDRNSHLVKQVVIETEGGPLTTTYSDWRLAGGVKLPYRQIRSDNVGEVTTFVVEQVELLDKIPPVRLARPTRSQHGRFLSADLVRVPFTYVGSHIMVPAKVNDVDANVIFDTGAANYFSPASAHRFGLQVSGGLNLGGVGESSITAGFAKADQISLGGAELKDEIVMVGPTPWGDRPSKQGPSADGIVGFEFLAEFRTTIDYPAQTINFSAFSKTPPAASSGITLPFYSDGQSIYVEAEVEQQRGIFILDTGDGGTVALFPNFAKRHHLDQNLGEGVVTPGGIGGKVSARRLTLKQFTLAGAHFRDLPAKLSQNTAGAFAPRSRAGNIGGGILRCFRVTFDYAARRVTFESDAEHLRDCGAFTQSKSALVPSER